MLQGSWSGMEVVVVGSWLLLDLALVVSDSGRWSADHRRGSPCSASMGGPRKRGTISHRWVWAHGKELPLQ